MLAACYSKGYEHITVPGDTKLDEPLNFSCLSPQNCATQWPRACGTPNPALRRSWLWMVLANTC